MANIKNIAPEAVIRMLKDMELEARTYSDGNVYTIFPADSDFGHDVVFNFETGEDAWLGIQAFADGFEIADDKMPEALAICNDFCNEAKMPKAFVKNRRFKLEQWFRFEENTSEEFIEDQIRTVMSMTWSFFTIASKYV